MEELLAYAILLSQKIITEDAYEKRRDELFLKNPEDEMLLYLEWENDLKKAIIYIRTHVNYNIFDYELFGKILMDKLNDYYKCSDIKTFGDQMYFLWESLPGNIQDEKPFHTLSYADDALSYDDEGQARKLYEEALNYYKS